ncbi:MAG: response regulator [Deltaproteobacteria bacterium]|nr:response regulator [Deltaproteobacteria bacterium]
MSALTSHRLLLVDDDNMVREAYSELLIEYGYNVDTAYDGIDALGKMEATPYDLVIVDINMPMLDGIDLYKEVSSLYPDMKDKFLFVTGDLYGEVDAFTVFIQNNKKILKKPFTKDEFIGTIRRMLDKQ